MGDASFLRDHAILAVLFGWGLRRSEVAALTVTHVQQRDGRWCIVDLAGKHSPVRTVPVPTWVKVAKLGRAAGGEVEQIQLLLGHASVQTTER